MVSGGNAGPAVEVIVGGLELATLVFMNLEEREDGDVEIKGIRYGEMPLQIIDTDMGWSDLLALQVRRPSTKPFIQNPLSGYRMNPTSNPG